MRQVSIVKTRKNYHYKCLLASLRHDASLTRHAWSCLVAMAMPLMQSISGGNDRTYTLYMSPVTAGMLGLPCQPCSGPWKLKFGDY